MRAFPQTLVLSIASVTLMLAALAWWGGIFRRKAPSSVSRFPADLGNSKIAPIGVYPDGWVADSASLNLDEPSGAQVLTVRGIIPSLADPSFQSDVALLLGQKEIGRRTFGVGAFELSASVPRQPGPQRVSVIFSKTQRLPRGDNRDVGGQIQFLGFESAGEAKAVAAPDIVKGKGVRLGSGWGPLESFAHDAFRWVDNDAELIIAPEQSGEIGLSITAEAGPGVDGKCLLKALDASGQRLAAEGLEGKSVVTMFIPVEAGKPMTVRLHVDDGGKKIPSDPRILNFRVFQVEATSWR